MAEGDAQHFAPDLVAAIDQSEAMVDEMLTAIVAHWEGDDCPGTQACLGCTADHIGEAVDINPAAIGMALQVALSRLAKQEYARRHP